MSGKSLQHLSEADSPRAVAVKGCALLRSAPALPGDSAAASGSRLAMQATVKTVACCGATISEKRGDDFEE